jgi:RNA polymerase sigma factor for flagellar operon FliA
MTSDSNPSADSAAPVPPAGVPAAAWRAYAGVRGGVIDEKELTERYLPLVRNVVDRIKMTLPAHIEAADLYSVGFMGLLAAVKKYDPEQGSAFATYASTRIRGAVLDELRRQDWCSRRARARARQIKAALGQLEQRLGRSAGEDEICRELGVSHAEYAAWLDESRPATFIPLHQDYEDQEGGRSGSLQDTLADEGDTTGRESLEKAETLELLTQRIAALPVMQRKILGMYYQEGMRLAEIAAVCGVTESRISQIHSQAILGLRAFLARARNA